MDEKVQDGLQSGRSPIIGSRTAVQRGCLIRRITATWRSGYAADCKSVYTGSIPVVASNTQLETFSDTTKCCAIASYCRPLLHQHAPLLLHFLK